MSALVGDALDDAREMEDLESFRQRARTWIRANLREVSREEQRWDRPEMSEEEELASVARDRQLQRMLFDAGLAGICFPRQYGGQGLSQAHQSVLNEELGGREFPMRIQVPTFSPCAAVILEYGTAEQKLAHLPAILKGEELWMQFLSEPSGGSDVAGALTTAVRDGEEWVLNGSKVWTTGAWWSDWGLALVRTNWDVPKHRGLSVFMLPIHQDGVEVHRIEMLNGSREFCQEFITDVVVPDSDRIGHVDDGWTVGIRWMFHERMLFNSPYVTFPASRGRAGATRSTVYAVAEELGLLDDPAVRELVGEARMFELVGEMLRRRVGASIRSGRLNDQAAAIGRLFQGISTVRTSTLALEVAGSSGAAWLGEGETAHSAVNFLMRQVGSIGGGTTEMARNVISERVLLMPREHTLDKDVAFRDVPRTRHSSS